MIVLKKYEKDHTKSFAFMRTGIIHFLPLILIGGVIIAVIGGIIYFNQNSPPEGQDIVTTNTDEYSVKDLIYVPIEEWKHEQGYNEVVDSEFAKFNYDAEGGADFILSAEPNNKNLSLKEWSDQMTSIWHLVDTTESEINIDGYSALQITGVGDPNYNHYNSIVGKNKSVTITLINKDEYTYNFFGLTDQYQKEYDQILSTFEFVTDLKDLYPNVSEDWDSHQGRHIPIIVYFPPSWEVVEENENYIEIKERESQINKIRIVNGEYDKSIEELAQNNHVNKYTNYGDLITAYTDTREDTIDATVYLYENNNIFHVVSVADTRNQMNLEIVSTLTVLPSQ